MAFKTTLTTVALAAAAFALPQPQTTNEPNRTDQRLIEWENCPDVEAQVFESIGVPIPQPFECATLPVPLDYTDRSLGTLNLSLIRVNATREPVLGSVLFNPGGPGGTGVENLAYQAPELHAVLGGQYNLVSWDPRGTGKTIPFDCQYPASEANLTRRDTESLVSINVTERFLNGGFEGAAAYAEICYTSANETGELIGTAFTARDMVQIIDALGEDGMLRYWGLSYGTQLGDTFAAMFPERVERMLLDANMNPHDYQAGHYGDYLRDADKTLEAFLDECIENADRCALAQFSGATNTSELFDVFNAGLSLIAQNATLNSTAYFTYASLKQTLYTGLYFPRRWPRLADTLTSFLNGSAFENATTQSNESTRVPYDLGVNSIDGIRCGDSLIRISRAEDYLDRVEYQSTLSPSFSDIGFEGTWACAAWRMRAREQYTGNFTAKTRYPILFVNGEYDPATPLVSARNASAGFEGSVVLQHSGYGHGLAAHPSSCVARAVQAYFKDGLLPATRVGTVCEPDVGPWDLDDYLLGQTEATNSTSRRRSSPMSGEDADLVQAMIKLGKLQERMSGLD